MAVVASSNALPGDATWMRVFATSRGKMAAQSDIPAMPPGRRGTGGQRGLPSVSFRWGAGEQLIRAEAARGEGSRGRVLRRKRGRAPHTGATSSSLPTPSQVAVHA